MPCTPWYRTRDDALYEPLARLAERVPGTDRESEVMGQAMGLYEDTLQKLLDTRAIVGGYVAVAPDRPIHPSVIRPVRVRAGVAREPSAPVVVTPDATAYWTPWSGAVALVDHRVVYPALEN